MLDEKFLVRNIEADKLVESFLISAVASILAIRVFLKVTNYPIIGGEVTAANIILGVVILAMVGLLLMIAIGGYSKEIAIVAGGVAVLILALTLIGRIASKFAPTGEGGIQIAHMLWGGILMTLALLSLLTLLGKHAAQIAAVVGGIGFGAFIDEIGKFMTRDNNYFYQPAIAVIYITFILIYLGFQLFKKYSVLSKDEYLINAVEYLKEVVHHDLDADEKKKALRLLDKCENTQIAASLRRLFRNFDSIQAPKPGPIARTRKTLHLAYLWLVRKRWFTTTLIWFFIAITAFSLWGAALAIKGGLSAIEWGELFFSGAAGLFVIAGIASMRISRLRAYRLFRYSVLVSIFLTQFFVFFREQLSAVLGLFGNIAILLVIEYMIDEEERILRNGKNKNGNGK